MEWETKISITNTVLACEQMTVSQLFSAVRTLSCSKTQKPVIYYRCFCQTKYLPSIPQRLTITARSSRVRHSIRDSSSLKKWRKPPQTTSCEACHPGSGKAAWLCDVYCSSTENAGRRDPFQTDFDLLCGDIGTDRWVDRLGSVIDYGVVTSRQTHSCLVFFKGVRWWCLIVCVMFDLLTSSCASELIRSISDRSCMNHSSYWLNMILYRSTYGDASFRLQYYFIIL